VFAIRIDCSDSRSVREAFEGVLSLGFVEVLVYNANYESPLQSKPTPFQRLSIQTFQTSLAVSSLGAFNCAQQVVSLLCVPPYQMFLSYSIYLINKSLSYNSMMKLNNDL